MNLPTIESKLSVLTLSLTLVQQIALAHTNAPAAAPADANVRTLEDQPHRAPADLLDRDAFRQKVKAVFFSYGSREERRATAAKVYAEALRTTGINSHYSESSLIGQERQSWRRGLKQFAPLLFKE